jgi:hypothetical protein
MRKNISIYLVILLCITGYNTSHATSSDTNNLQALKFEMIKKAVGFYSKDTSLLNHKSAPDCSNVPDIQALLECSKGLTGVDKKIMDFDQSVVANRQNLVDLKLKIVSRINTKPYRTKLDGYDDFIKSLDEMVNMGEEQTASTTKEIIPLTAGNAPPVTEPEASSGLTIWDIIAMALSLLAIILSIISLTAKKKRRSSSSFSNQSESNSLPGDNEFVLNDLRANFRILEEQVNKIQSHLSDQMRETYKNTTESNAHTSRPQQSAHVIKYAKTADGNAFAADALSDVQDNKKIYELTILSPDRGTFKVTSNKEAQLFALEDPNNYLRGACNYRSLPTFDSTIITDTPGRLELNGNKWSIVTPAEIDFS